MRPRLIPKKRSQPPFVKEVVEKTHTDYRPDVHYVNYVPVACDQAWGPRANLDFELVLIVAGRFSYADEKSEKMTCVPGDVLCIPPACRHVLKNIQAPEKLASIISCIHLEMFNGSFLCGDYALATLPPRLTRTGKDPVVHELFKRCETIFAGFSLNRIALLQAVAWEILLHLEEFQSGGAERLSPRMRDMLDFIQRNVERSVGRADLARKFSIPLRRYVVAWKRMTLLAWNSTRRP